MNKIDAKPFSDAVWKRFFCIFVYFLIRQITENKKSLIRIFIRDLEIHLGILF